MLPSFIGAGTQRGGTTWLYHCLKEHPQVCMPEKKEIHYFSSHWEKGLQWYESFFKNCYQYNTIGEFTPNYLQSHNALRRMAQVLPKAKIIISLREPLERAFSAYTLLKKNNHYKNVSFVEAFNKGGPLQKIGYYSRQIEELYTLFDPKQIHIILYDDIQQEFIKVIQELYYFLNLDDKFIPQSAKITYNKIILPELQNSLQRLGLESWLENFKQTFAGQWLRKFLAQSKQTNKNKELQQARSLKKVYKEDIMKLQSLIQRDLSPWLDES